MECLDKPIPRGPKQDLFFAYLNHEIAMRSEYTSMVRGVTNDRSSFKSIVTALFLEPFGRHMMQWTFLTSSTGDLVSVEVSAPQASSTAWESEAHKIMRSALLSVYTDSRTRVVKRRPLYYVGPPLDGEYWFGRSVRLAPAPLADPWPGLVNAENFALLDMELDAINDQDAEYLASQSTRVWSARLSLILDRDLYEHVGEHVWVSVLDRDRTAGLLPDGPTRLRLLRGVLDLPPPGDMPRKGQECWPGKSDQSITDQTSSATLKIPSETRRILRGLRSLGAQVQEAFDGAARMYQIGLSMARRFPSAALAYRVAAVDSLAQSGSTAPVEDRDSKRIFCDFMQRHSPRVDTRLLNYLYSEIRSSHFHAGRFGLAEYLIQRHHDMVQPWGPDIQKQAHLSGEGFAATREALVNWMLSIADEDKKSPREAGEKSPPGSEGHKPVGGS